MKRRALESQAITTMKCERTQKVSLLIDGELPPAEAHEVERHLNLCGDCRTAREDFLLLRRQIADYPLSLDAFARQRALKRILAAAGGSGTKLENETPPPHRRESFAGVFGMPRLGVAGLAALLLLLVGVAVGVVSLMSSRRAHVEVASNAPTHAPAHNSNDGSSTAATPFTPTPAPDDLKADASKADDGEKAAGNDQKRAGEESPNGASRNAEAVADRAGMKARRVERGRGGVLKSSSTPANTNPPRAEASVAESARNDVEAVDGEVGASDVSDDAATGSNRERAGAAGESKTARPFLRRLIDRKSVG